MPDPSPIELAFWEAASPRIPDLQREVPIGPFRVDFLIPDKKVVVELYGYVYHGGKEKQTQDAQRERYLQKLGYQVVRYTGQDVHRDVNGCVNDLLAILATIPDNNVSVDGSNLKQAGSSQPPNPAPISASSQKLAKLRPTQQAKPNLRIGEGLVIGVLGLAAMLVLGALALVIMIPSSPTQTVPSEIPTLIPTLNQIATLLPTPPLLSADSALRVADCAYYSSWKSIFPGKPTTLTPPADAICGIFAFDVSSGETPTIIFNDERYTDLGSCAYKCIVYIRAVEVFIDVQGLKKPGATWSVQYYWNSGPPD